MARWKWFQRKDQPVDVVRRPRYSHRAGAYAPPAGDKPAWNAPTAVFPQDRPLMTMAAQWRTRNAVKGSRW
ncbi:hypothetical protein AB0K04_17745 [Micromonospora coxensis]|uniref:hypothetical protein n=1 Tax=Micromonospora coxensis TaxID=356852 RepID=UPI0034411A4F